MTFFQQCMSDAVLSCVATASGDSQRRGALRADDVTQARNVPHLEQPEPDGNIFQVQPFFRLKQGSFAATAQGQKRVRAPLFWFEHS